MAGCGDQETADDAAQTPSAPVVTPSTASAPAAVPTSTSAAAADGCPVDADTLFAALRADKKLAAAIPRSVTSVKDVVCYQGYATAYTVVNVNEADPAAIVYRYDPGSRTWKALNLGTDAVCTDIVPARVIPHLPGCVGS
ncbi:hypothetical protein GCM10027290_37070 [Micromonospora sonneratiae]